MTTITKFLIFFALPLVGCTQTKTVSDNRTKYSNERVTYTGSNVPQPANRVTDQPLSANSPSQSVSRNTPSLYPTDPVVGASAGPSNTGDTGPYRDVGAGPAGSNPLPGSR